MYSGAVTPGGITAAEWLPRVCPTGRYTNSPESTFDRDIRQIDARGIDAYAADVFAGELSDAFWSTALPQEMNTSVASSPYFRVFQAAQVVLGDKGFLSSHISVRDLLEVKSDVHHIFPRAFLKREGLARGQYNQVANYAVAQSEINIAIGSKPPAVVLTELLEQCNGGPRRYGNITDPDELRENLRMHCIPEGAEGMGVEDYLAFLAERRRLMAQKIKTYSGRL